MESENVELFKELVKKAELGQHHEFEFLRTISGRKAAKTVLKASKSVKQTFKDVSDNAVKIYFDSNGRDLKALIDSERFEKCLHFYQDEEKIIKEIIYEYDCYLRAFPFRWVLALLGQEREEKDLFRHDILPEQKNW